MKWATVSSITASSFSGLAREQTLLRHRPHRVSAGDSPSMIRSPKSSVILKPGVGFGKEFRGSRDVPLVSTPGTGMQPGRSAFHLEPVKPAILFQRASAASSSIFFMGNPVAPEIIFLSTPSFIKYIAVFIFPSFSPASLAILSQLVT